MNCFNETYVKLKRIQKLKGIFVKEEDELLIKEALAGKEKAFKLLLNKHREAIYHLVLKIVHNPEEARDLVQETFMKAFGSLATYKSEYRFTTWLYRIAANSSIDHLRKKKVESLSLNHPLETEDGTVGIELPDWTYNPEVDLV
ncbi:MAG: RNA polymerase sigma factor, partial [Candidatus Zixiibacteriota bacterium]